MRRIIALLLCIALIGCTSGRGSGTAPTTSSTRGDGVVVASFNFSESSIVAELYAQVLERAGIPVHRELALGPRELVQPAMVQGFVDLVPEYLGSALRSVQPSASVDPNDAEAVRGALGEAVAPWGLHVLRPGLAQDQNGLVTTRDKAGALGLTTVSDLRAHAGQMVIGGPPECPARPLCLPGYEQRYGLHFAQFLPLATLDQEKTALEQGVIDVAVMFTTDGHLDAPDLRLLDDDRHLQPAENVTPLVSARVLDRYGAKVSGLLDAVSATLTSTALRFLNWRVEIAHREVAAEVRGWIERNLPP